MRRHRSRDRDRGAADALSLVLIAPFAIGLALLVVVLGRRVESEAQLRTAAEAAAQAAALERNDLDAARAATAVAEAMLVSEGTCTDLRVVPSPLRVDEAVGTSLGTRSVTIFCTVPNEGVGQVLPDPVELSATAHATVDLFRAGG